MSAKLATLMKKVDTRLETLIDEAKTKHKMKVPKFGLVYNLKGASTAGMACYKDGNYFIRLHPVALEAYGDDYIESTVVHEFSHIVQMVNYPTSKPHGNEWKSIMVRLGKDPQRCHPFKLGDAIMKQTGKVDKRTIRHKYKCGCSIIHEVSTVRHNKMVKGISKYKCNDCGELLVKC